MPRKDQIPRHAKPHREPHPKSVYRSFLFGGFIAKLSYHIDYSPVEWRILVEQTKNTARSLGLEEDLIKEVVGCFVRAIDAKQLTDNASVGMKTKDSLVALLATIHDNTIARAFRAGFNLVYIKPALEIVGVSEEGIHQGGPSVESLYASTSNLLHTFASDCAAIGVSDELVKQLGDTEEKLGALGASAAGERLAVIRKAIEHEVQLAGE